MKTKISLFLFLAFMLISIGSFAQINWGLRTGAAVTTLANKGDLTDNNNVTFSYTAGGFMDLPLSRSLFIQPEINYVRKGRSDETTQLNSANPTDFMVHYMQVPVLLQYRDANMFERTGSAFFISAGPYAGFALNNQVRPSGNVVVADSKNTDWGTTFGIGFQTPIYKQNIRFDLRYDMGLSSVSNQPADYRTKALCLTVGIIF
jgi:hypothetical protein